MEVKQIKRRKPRTVKPEGNTKICSSCKENKSIDEFNLARANKSTRHKTMCKMCQKAKNSVYYAKKKDVVYKCKCGYETSVSNKYEHLKSVNHLKKMEEISLEAVKKDWCALEYVENQTEEMCLLAVKECGLALQYVKNKTKKICDEAVKTSKYASQYTCSDSSTDDSESENDFTGVDKSGNRYKIVIKRHDIAEDDFTSIEDNDESEDDDMISIDLLDS